ncbi:MAG: thioredoxin family protein [Bacillaceae bacterium]
MEKISRYEEMESFINSNEIAIFLVKSYTCKVCEDIEWKLEHFLKGYKAIPTLAAYIEDVPLIAGNHLVMSAPTILFFQDGKEIHREAGFVSFEKIDRLLTLLDKKK